MDVNGLVQGGARLQFQDTGLSIEGKVGQIHRAQRAQRDVTQPRHHPVVTQQSVFAVHQLIGAPSPGQTEHIVIVVVDAVCFCFLFLFCFLICLYFSRLSLFQKEEEEAL